jgi:hypothetical protein
MGWVRIRRFGPHVVAVTLAAVGAMTCGGAQYDRIARTVLALDQGDAPAARRRFRWRGDQPVP